MKIDELRMIDIREPEQGVEVLISEDNKRLWVNVDGVCVVRIQEMKEAPEILTVD